MKILIAGAGKVGAAVAGLLSDEGHDITIIDRSAERIDTLSNNLDVICVQGSATDAETLTEAGAGDADLVVAATRNDEINMVCGISARKLGTRHVVARIRDTAYINQLEFLREALGLDTVINPELECAREISRILRFPTAIFVDLFSNGRVEMIKHRISADSRLNGRQLKELPSAFGAKVLVGLVGHKTEAIIPNGDYQLAAGDLISVLGSAGELRKFFVATGEFKKPVRSVMIMGGGRIAVYLAKLLMEAGIKVSVVEKDRERCDELCDALPNAAIIHADATRGDVLREEGLDRADAFVALTGDDGSNIITSMYAKSCNVGKIVVKVNQDYYSDILTGAGLDSVVTPRMLVSQQLARYVRAMSNSEGSSMETLYQLAEGRVEAMEFKVEAGSLCLGRPLKNLTIKKNTIVAAIVRGKHTIIPDGNTEIHPGDHVVIIAMAGKVKSLDSIIEVR